MAMDAFRAVIASICHALLRALTARSLRPRHRRYYIIGTSSSSSSSWCVVVVVVVVLAVLLSAATAAFFFPRAVFFFPRAVTFFLPLAASTSALCAAAYYLSTDPDRGGGAAKEVVLVRGEGRGPPAAEAGTLQVYADADTSAYGSGGGEGVRVGCFLRKSATRGVDVDGEEVVFAGRLLVPAPSAASAFEEEVASLQVDRLAEGVWDSYFGRWSTWNHYDDGCEYESTDR